MSTLIARRLIRMPKSIATTSVTTTPALPGTSATWNLRKRQAHHSAVEDMLQRQKYDNLYNIDISKINIDSIKAEFVNNGDGNITLVKDDQTGIAKLTLSNPKIHNAISGKMMCELNDAIVELEGWNEGKGVIVRYYNFIGNKTKV